MSETDKSLLTHHENALEQATKACPSCQAELVIKHGKSGTFLGCIKYPHCEFTQAVIESERVEDKILSGSECPLCHYELAVKQGRYGMFIGCSNFPNCNHIEHEAQEIVENVVCPSCKKASLQEKTSRFGKKFYSCNAYPRCKFVVNYEPVAGCCEQCQFPLLLKRNMAAGIKYQCADKKCSYMHKV